MALRHNNELSMWQCKRCGSFWHGEPPERGGTPCECTRPQAPEPLPVPTPSQQKQKSNSLLLISLNFNYELLVPSLKSPRSGWFSSLSLLRRFSLTLRSNLSFSHFGYYIYTSIGHLLGCAMSESEFFYPRVSFKSLLLRSCY